MLKPETKERIIEALKKLEEKNGRYPTRKELSEFLGRKRQTISLHIRALEKLGLVETFVSSDKVVKIKYVNRNRVRPSK